MKILYPTIDSFNSFYLETGSLHKVYIEQSGNKQGIPVIFLHGGPCSGTKPDHRRFFHPEKYHIILMDQRGSGQSLPYGEIEGNTTQAIIDDMERVRKQLGIEKWLLFGGSWGSTLTLLYTQQHKWNVLGMVIRGVFLARQKDLNWFGEKGAGRIYPEKWKQLTASVSKQTDAGFVGSLYDTVFGKDDIATKQATKAWMEWGGQVALLKDYQEDESMVITDKMVKQVKMELHYAQNKYFIEEGQVLNNCRFLQGIPTIIIHGRNDLVCPVESGMSLHNVLPNAEYNVLPNAGHIAKGEEMIDALVDAADRMAELIQ
jgi:proline iminopeptidase